MMEVLRVLWRGGQVEHHGEYYAFDRLEMSPAPDQPVPIYVGGTSELALRRAARLGDGWVGMYHSIDELADIATFIRKERAAVGRGDEPFDLVASPQVKPDAATVAALEAAGVTTLLTSAWMGRGVKRVTRDEAVAMVAAYGERFIQPLGA
jgi:alkanesulfonate monooxygenase SsuD/methylene tetrahydromethanopterin reductase-like flavin-dependent oxidoreductase (luciferase family)